MDNTSSENSFEKLIQQEVGALDLDSGMIDQVETSEKISEVVKEQKTDGTGVKTGAGTSSRTSAKDTTFSIANLTLPTPEKQKKELQRVIQGNIKDLVREVMKIQKSKNYSAARLEEVIREIRKWRKLLVEIFSATMERVEELYRKFVFEKR